MGAVVGTASWKLISDTDNLLAGESRTTDALAVLATSLALN